MTAICWENYRVADPDALPTPAMIVFEALVDHNIRSVRELAGGARNLFTHVKTHKSAAVTRKQLEQGIDSFKCATAKELEMVLQAGARRAILAYPQVQASKVERLMDAVAAWPDAWIATIASSLQHLDMLGSVAKRRRQPLRVMLDVDLGMHRTGVEADSAAAALYWRIDRHSCLEAAGLHAYDGHDTLSDPKRRAAAAQRHIKSLRDLQRRIESTGSSVPLVVAGGAYSFSYFAQTDGMHGSPGSFIYWDARCHSDMSDLPFRCAALILTQVVDRHPGQRTVTTDLGDKSLCSDLPLPERARLLGYESAHLAMQNEEYGVFRMQDDLPEIGTYLLAVPGHIGPTTVRYPGAHVIDTEGQQVDFYVHTARDRI